MAVKGKLIGTGRRRRQHQFLARSAGTGRDRCTGLCLGIDCTHQTGTDIAQRIVGLAPVGNLFTVNRNRIEILDRTRQGDRADLLRQGGASDRHGVIAVAHMDVLGVADDNRIIAGTQGKAIGAVTQINQQVASTCQSLRVVTVRSGIRRHRRVRTVGVEALAVNAVARAVLAVGTPGNDEAAVLESCQRLLVLVTRHVCFDPELGLGTQRRREAAIAMVKRDQHFLGRVTIGVAVGININRRIGAVNIHRHVRSNRRAANTRVAAARRLVSRKAGYRAIGMDIVIQHNLGAVRFINLPEDISA